MFDAEKYSVVSYDDMVECLMLMKMYNDNDEVVVDIKFSWHGW